MKRVRLISAALLLTAGVAHAAQSASAPAVQTQTAVATAGSFFQVLMGLIVVLGLMAAIAWSLKRFNVARIAGNAPVKVVGGVSVGNRERVMVVEVADQWIVVGVASGQVTALSTMARPEQMPAPNQEPLNNNFAGWLKQKIDKRNAE